MQFIKRIAARLPSGLQNELKRIHFGRQIVRNKFVTDEPEFKILDTLVRPGDWVLDIGANVGHYTKRFSDLVGPAGRVIAFEPVPTFSLLAANVQLLTHSNVSLFNAAVSDRLDVVTMTMPEFSSGLKNYYEAHLTPGATDGLNVLTLPVDSLCITQRIAVIKIDAEGHERFVLSGMQDLIARSRPTLIVETGSEEIIQNFAALGYVFEKFLNSPNILFKPKN
jgi:FkbM family methyltransferase